MSEHKQGLKVTASDALEFEPVSPKLKKAGNALKTVLFVVLAVSGGAAGWAYYGDRIISIVGDSGSDVPIIRAELGPVKVRPASPGGLQVPDRDILVYNRMRSSGSGQGGAPTVERLLPMPENPITQPQFKSAQQAVNPPSPTQTDSTTEQTVAGQVAGKQTSGAISLAPVKPKRINVTPSVADVARAEKPVLAPPAPPGPETASTTSAAPKKLQSSSTRANSTNIASISTTTSKITKSAKTPVSAPSSALPVSNKAYRVQLAAARTPGAARGEWDKLRRKHLDLLGDLGLTVTKVDLGGSKGVFYRLRVGPLSDRLEAKALCKTLAKRKVSCLVVRPGK